MTTAVGMWSLSGSGACLDIRVWSRKSRGRLLGAGEGATFPGGLRTVAQTLPPEKRGRGLAISYSGGSLGAMITPFIVTPIALRFGWRGAFLVTGSFGFAWLIFWRFVARGIEERVETREQKLPWSHPALWAYIGAYALGAMPLGFILYDSSLYLHARFAWDQATLGKVLWIPPLGWEVGYFVWGWVGLTAQIRRADAGMPRAEHAVGVDAPLPPSSKATSGDLRWRGSSWWLSLMRRRRLPEMPD